MFTTTIEDRHDTPTSAAAAAPAQRPAALQAQCNAPEPDRLPGDFLCAALDKLDLSMLVVGADGALVHANGLARQTCGPAAMLSLHGRTVRVRGMANQSRLDKAIAEAHRGHWSLLVLTDGRASITLGVVPMGDSGSGSLVLLIPGRPKPVSAMALQMFALSHRLTSAEGAVLASLCQGFSPTDIARQGKVSIATVRTQITAIREKTQASSLRHLLQMVASLPPLMGAALSAPR